MLSAIISSTFLFLTYVQFSPSMGNIWYRNEHFAPLGALKLMVYPFQNIEMWKPQLWDINYPLWLLFSMILSKMKFSHL